MSQLQATELQPEEVFIRRIERFNEAYHNAFFKEVDVVLSGIKHNRDALTLQDSRSWLKKMVLYTVNLTNGLRQSCANSNGKLHAMELAITFLKQITPRELMQIFPTDKGSKGNYERYQRTMARFKVHGMDKTFDDALYTLLIGYSNVKLKSFFLALMMVLDEFGNDTAQKEKLTQMFGITHEELMALHKRAMPVRM